MKKYGFKVEKNVLQSAVPKLEASNELLSSSQGSYMKDDGVPMDVDNLNRKKPSSCLKIARTDLFIN